MSMPLAIFDRNQGEIAKSRHAITQAEEQHLETSSQVLTDVRDAYEAFQTNDKVAQFYTSGYLEIARKNRDISEYAYQKGATSLLDFLDAERNYRSTERGYRQAVAACLTALEQIRQAIGTRDLP